MLNSDSLKQWKYYCQLNTSIESALVGDNNSGLKMAKRYKSIIMSIASESSLLYRTRPVYF